MRVRRLGIALLFVAVYAQAHAQVRNRTEDVCTAANRSLAQHNFLIAQVQFESCLKDSPLTLERLSNLGMAYAGQEKFDLAIKAYKNALALDPNSPVVRMNMGLALMKTAHASEAAAEFARTLMSDPDSMKALELLAFCHYQMKNFELAAAEAARVLRAQPDDASAALLLGSALLRLGLFKQAIPLIYTSIRNTDSAEARILLGEAFVGVRAYRSALREFQAAEAKAPSYPGLHASIGTAYAGLSEVDKGMAQFQLELGQDPDNFQANYYLGRLHRLKNEPETARKYLAIAERLRPGDPSVAYEYAVFAMQAKDYPKAADLLQQIIEKLPNYKDAHVLLAEAYFKLRRTEDGMREKAIVDALKKVEQEEEDMGGRTFQPSATKPSGNR